MLADLTPCHVSPGFLEEVPYVFTPFAKPRSTAEKPLCRRRDGLLDLPIPSLNRYPQPASRPEMHSTSATKCACLAGWILSCAVAECFMWVIASENTLDTRRPEGVHWVLNPAPTSFFLMPTPERSAGVSLPNPPNHACPDSDHLCQNPWTKFEGSRHLHHHRFQAPRRCFADNIAPPGKVLTESNLPPKLPRRSSKPGRLGKYPHGSDPYFR